MLRPTQVRQHVRFMQSRGFSVDEVLAGSRIIAARLDDPSYLVDLRQSHKVVANMLQLTGDSGLGFELGESTSFNDLGVVGYAMASASTLGQGIGLWLQYGRSPVGFAFTVDLHTHEDGSWSVSPARFDMALPVFRFYIEETVLMGQTLGTLLTGTPFEFSDVKLAYPAPKYHRQYRRRFRCPVQFDAPETRITVRSPSLSTSLRNQDNELRELCVRHCSRLLRHIDRRGPVSERLRDYLTARGTIPSLDQAAADLNMSARSLRRYLRDEQTTFQVVLDEFRCDLAREYLGTRLIPVKEVAHLLGFSHVDSFGRAFKNWTGQAPSQFQP